MTAKLSLLNAQDEIVNGMVIGEIQNPFRAKLFYDGRSQQEKFCFGASQNEAVGFCKKKLQEKKDEMGHLFKEIYAKELWEVRVWKDGGEW